MSLSRFAVFLVLIRGSWLSPLLTLTVLLILSCRALSESTLAAEPPQPQEELASQAAPTASAPPAQPTTSVVLSPRDDSQDAPAIAQPTRTPGTLPGWLGGAASAQPRPPLRPAHDISNPPLPPLPPPVLNRFPQPALPPSPEVGVAPLAQNSALPGWLGTSSSQAAQPVAVTLPAAQLQRSQPVQSQPEPEPETVLSLSGGTLVSMVSLGPGDLAGVLIQPATGTDPAHQSRRRRRSSARDLLLSQGSGNYQRRSPSNLTPAQSELVEAFQPRTGVLPSLTLRTVLFYNDSELSARARLSGRYPLSRNLLIGGSLDLATGSTFVPNSQNDGLLLNELYVTASLPSLPNLRFVVGQIDLTSYFDRNSFAKDAVTHFFNPVFATNPALAAATTASRPGILVNWSASDTVEARVAAFSSQPLFDGFSLDSIAAELAVRPLQNLILRATYVSSRDGGERNGYLEAGRDPDALGQGGIDRIGSDDRETAYGLNAEYFIPRLKLGLFARYGHYRNQDQDEEAETYSVGLTALDLFQPLDRLGLAYGRQLSAANLRRSSDDNPDVLELFYDFQLTRELRAGVSVQSLNQNSETVFGFRLRSDLNLTPRRRAAPLDDQGF